MFICLCRAVRERTIVSAIDEGARSVDDVGGACGAGTVCGTCRPLIQQILDGVQAQGGAPPPHDRITPITG